MAKFEATRRYDIVNNQTNEVIMTNLTYDQACDEISAYYFDYIKCGNTEYRFISIRKNKELSRKQYEYVQEKEQKAAKRRAKHRAARRARRIREKEEKNNKRQ